MSTIPYPRPWTVAGAIRYARAAHLALEGLHCLDFDLNHSSAQTAISIIDTLLDDHASELMEEEAGELGVWSVHLARYGWGE